MRRLTTIIIAILLFLPLSGFADAPTGDVSEPVIKSAVFYYCKTGTGYLGSIAKNLSFPVGRLDAETLIREWLNFDGDGLLSRPGSGAALSLAASQPLELSGSTLTVNLSSSALQLDKSELYALCQCLTNTLTESGSIKYVNFIVEGHPLSIDIRGLLPLGAFSRSVGTNVESAYEILASRRVSADGSAESQSFDKSITLYYPALYSRGILAETRSVSFAGQSAQQVLNTILSEISKSAQTLSCAIPLPSLTSFLAAVPSLAPVSGGGVKACFSFTEPLNTALSQQGVTRSVFLASLCYTVCTFYPEAMGIDVTIGETHISNVSPSGVFDGESRIDFTDYLQQRRSYSGFLMNTISLYYIEDDHLTEIMRPVQQSAAALPRTTALEWLRGAAPYDSKSAVYPLGAAFYDSDIIGISISGELLTINFSSAVKNAFLSLDSQRERLACYALVNTLCSLPNVRRVQFYFANSDEGELAGGVYWGGDFWLNPGIVR
ncbi:MAG: GerMN domain-containing protein [Eubacteriales bacterium]|nr:GerMN domain-containing protein [Eubacteriales bacterium]MDD3882929.1 GerMN domain-containing protein [Eubacteriales bacterium]MDD4513524.1 GerMN domain-containing protein [Eubacteriales bacterium]